MRLPKLRELLEAVKAPIVGPYTSRFPKKPHVPYKSFRGQPKFNPDYCVGCLACEEVCPVKAIGHADKKSARGAVRVIRHYTDTCIFCGECEAACIADHKGIALSNDWDLAFFDRSASYETIEHELALCERCGEVVGARAHLEWIGERIGELAYSSPTLYQAKLKTLGVIDENLVPLHKDGGRSERAGILCAHCRRLTTMSGQTPPADGP